MLYFCTGVLLNLEFLHIIYQPKRVGGKVLLKLNVNDVGDEKHLCNAPAIAKSRTMFFKDNKLARIRSECASFIEDILAKSKGTLNGIIKFLIDK